MRGKILITGGLGNLGSWLTRHFAEQGFDVYVLTRKAKFELQGISYHVIEADITDIETLKHKITTSFDVCIHTASFNEYFLKNYAEKALLINTLGTRNLLEVLQVHGITKFVYLSTFHVYGASSGHITEGTPVSPKNDYATTHLCAEHYVTQFAFTCKLDYTIFRLSNSYGCPSSIQSDKWYLVLNDLVKSAYEERKIILKSNGQVLRDFIWMGDVCTIIEKSLEASLSQGIYNLSSSQSFKIIDLAKIVQHVYKERYAHEIAIEINEVDKTFYEPLCVDSSKLTKVLDISLHQPFENEVNKIFDLLEYHHE